MFELPGQVTKVIWVTFCLGLTHIIYNIWDWIRSHETQSFKWKCDNATQVFCEPSPFSLQVQAEPHTLFYTCI